MVVDRGDVLELANCRHNKRLYSDEKISIGAYDRRSPILRSPDVNEGNDDDRTPLLQKRCVVVGACGWAAILFLLHALL